MTATSGTPDPTAPLAPTHGVELEPGRITLSDHALEVLVATHEAATEIAISAVEDGGGPDALITLDARTFSGILVWLTLLMGAAALGKHSEVIVARKTPESKDAEPAK